jgi:hypothetical protein
MKFQQGLSFIFISLTAFSSNTYADDGRGSYCNSFKLGWQNGAESIVGPLVEIDGNFEVSPPDCPKPISPGDGTMAGYNRGYPQGVKDGEVIRKVRSLGAPTNEIQNALVERADKDGAKFKVGFQGMDTTRIYIYSPGKQYGAIWTHRIGSKEFMEFTNQVQSAEDGSVQEQAFYYCKIDGTLCLTPANGSTTTYTAKTAAEYIWKELHVWK